VQVYTPNEEQPEAGFIGGTSEDDRVKGKSAESASDDSTPREASHDPRGMLRAQLHRSKTLSVDRGAQVDPYGES
jgi:hypothetical protein